MLQGGFFKAERLQWLDRWAAFASLIETDESLIAVVAPGLLAT